MQDAKVYAIEDFSDWARSDLEKRHSPAEIEQLLDQGIIRPTTAAAIAADPRFSARMIDQSVDGYLCRFDGTERGQVYRQRNTDRPGRDWVRKLICQNGTEDGSHIPPLYLPEGATAITEGLFDATVPTLSLGVPIGAVNSPSLLANLKVPERVNVYVGDIDTMYGNCDILPQVIEACLVHHLNVAVAPKNPEGSYDRYPLSGRDKWGLEDAVRSGVLDKEGLEALLINAMTPADFMAYVFKEWGAAGITWKSNPQVLEHGIQACALLPDGSDNVLRALAKNACNVPNRDFDQICARKRRNRTKSGSRLVVNTPVKALMDTTALAFADQYAQAGQTVNNPAHVKMIVEGGLLRGLRLNILSRNIEFQPEEGGEFIEIEPSRAWNVCASAFPGLGMSASATRDVVIDLANSNTFNPLAQYLNSCRLDGKPCMPIKDIQAMFGLAENDYLSLAHVLVYFSNLADRWYKPGSKLDNMLNIISPQGYAKSTLVEMLAGKGEFYLSLNGSQDLESTNQIIALNASGLVELPESDGWTVKHDDDAIKRSLSNKTDSFTNKYETKRSNWARLYGVIGTTNETGLYRDRETRRFLTVTMDRPSSLLSVSQEECHRLADWFWGTILFLKDAGAIPDYFDNRSYHGMLSEERNRDFMIQRDGEAEVVTVLKMAHVWTDYQGERVTTAGAIKASLPMDVVINDKVLSKILGAQGLMQVHARPRQLVINGKLYDRPRLWKLKDGASLTEEVAVTPPTCLQDIFQNMPPQKSDPVEDLFWVQDAACSSSGPEEEDFVPLF